VKRKSTKEKKKIKKEGRGKVKASGVENRKGDKHFGHLPGNQSSKNKKQVFREKTLEGRRGGGVNKQSSERSGEKVSGGGHSPSF